MPHYSCTPDSSIHDCDDTLILQDDSTTPALFPPLSKAPSPSAPLVHINAVDQDPEGLSKAWPADPCLLDPLHTCSAAPAERQISQSDFLQVPSIPSLKLPPHSDNIDVDRVRAWLEAGNASEQDLNIICQQLRRQRSSSCLSSCSVSTSSHWAESTMDERLAHSRRTSCYDTQHLQPRLIDPASGSQLQPPSSNEAILAFSQRTSAPPPQGQNSEPFLGAPDAQLHRTLSNSRKRAQDSIDHQIALEHSAASTSDTSTTIAKRVLSKARSKSPRIDMPRHPRGSTSSGLGVWTNSEGRARSRSDASSAYRNSLEQGSALTGLYSGPSQQHQWLDSGLTFDPEEDEFNIPGSFGPFPVAEAPAAATPDAFQAHIRTLNPSLDVQMVERIAQEQVKRHQRLSDFQTKHESAVARKACPSGARCNVLGSGPNYALADLTSKQTDGPPAVFHVVQPDGSHEVPEAEVGTSIPATFPDGIPIPPVTRLPAEFECPLCFQVKKFMKPSDWTKHVHEDVQPFTCTFPTCVEPKSFKRKADWVRHESERHRHLESWRCEVPECWHVCYRKDNFVQHLVREHRLPEPRTKTGRVSKNSAAKQDDIISHLVEKCRVESSKSSVEEPCRFCGNLCASWKKLTVHLAKHMEQISMPVLELIGHHLPRSDDGPIQQRAVAQSASVPIPGSRNRQSMPEHSWSTPLMGPSISITSASGTTGLEHDSLAFYRHDQRETSETPSFYSNSLHPEMQHYDSDTSFLHPSTSSSPYMSSRSGSLGQPSPSLTAYSSDPGLLGVTAHSSWQAGNSPEARFPLLHSGSGPWQEQMMDPSSGSVTGFTSSADLSFGEGGAQAEPGDRMDLEGPAAGFQVPAEMSAATGLPEPSDPAWMARAYAAASKERNRARSASGTYRANPSYGPF